MEIRNEPFVCIWCSYSVPSAQKTSRNHCPQCFLCLHVDEVMPGDRWSSCWKRMIPQEYIIANGKIRIKFACIWCAKIHRNKCTNDDEVAVLDEQIAYWKKQYPEMS